MNEIRRKPAHTVTELASARQHQKTGRPSWSARWRVSGCGVPLFLSFLPFFPFFPSFPYSFILLPIRLAILFLFLLYSLPFLLNSLSFPPLLSFLLQLYAGRIIVVTTPTSDVPFFYFLLASCARFGATFVTRHDRLPPPYESADGRRLDLESRLVLKGGHNREDGAV